MDFNKLEKELFGVMQKDDKYWRENDAKFRAANKSLPTKNLKIL